MSPLNTAMSTSVRALVPELVNHEMGLLILADKGLASQSLTVVGPLAKLQAKEPATLLPLVDAVIAKTLKEDGLVAEPEGCALLLPFRTPSDHNCLCHSAAIAMWGQEDTQFTLRTAVRRNLEGPGTGANYFKEQWMHSVLERDRLAFGVEIERSSEQWAREWQEELHVVQDLGRSLTEIHVFVLAHVVRRPIIVYSPRFCKDVDGQELAPVYFGGVYLPVLLAPEDRPSRCPLVLAYSQSHFAALVPMERPTGESLTVALGDDKGQPLPIHYVDQTFFAPGSQGWRDLLQNYLDLSPLQDLATARLCDYHPCSFGAQLLTSAEAKLAAVPPSSPCIMPIHIPVLSMGALRTSLPEEEESPIERRTLSLTYHPEPPIHPRPVRRGQSCSRSLPEARGTVCRLDAPFWAKGNGSPAHSPRTAAQSKVLSSLQTPAAERTALHPTPAPGAQPPFVVHPSPTRCLPPSSPLRPLSPRVGTRSPFLSVTRTATSLTTAERHTSGRGSLPSSPSLAFPQSAQLREDSPKPRLQQASNSPAALSHVPALSPNPKKMLTVNCTAIRSRTPLSARTANSTPTKSPTTFPTTPTSRGALPTCAASPQLAVQRLGSHRSPSLPRQQSPCVSYPPTLQSATNQPIRSRS